MLDRSRELFADDVGGHDVRHVPQWALEYLALGVFVGNSRGRLGTGAKPGWEAHNSQSFATLFPSVELSVVKSFFYG